MSTSALAERPVSTVAVTNDQLDLIRRTIAKDATPDELKLYLYDCQRQGVHPLDKLIHFTKRSGKYTPITSIDFMRIRAADTGEYAGSDVALFAGQDGVWTSLWLETGPPLASMVTVWRIVQGQRCKFEAVARWAEYKPESNDFMWKKMPATMLSKCAEACALRKGFPRQLAGLYAKEELDQAESASPQSQSPRLITEPATDGASPSLLDTETGELLLEPPPGYHYVANYAVKNGWHEADLLKWDAQGGALHVSTKLKIGELLSQAQAFNVPVRADVTEKKNTKGAAYLNKLETLKPEPAAPVPGSDEAF